MSNPVADLFANLLAGFRLAFFLPVKYQRFRVSVTQWVLLIVVGLALVALADRLFAAPGARFDVQALPRVLIFVPVVLLLAHIFAQVLGSDAIRLGYPVSTEAAFVWVFLADAGLYLATLGFPYAPQVVYWLVIVWSLFVSLRALALFTSVRGNRLAACALAATVAAVAIEKGLPRPALFSVPETPVADAQKSAQSSILDEDVLFNQQALLSEALADLAPERPGVTDLYFVGMGLDATQGVFMRETQSVQELFDTRFDTEGRSIALINHRSTIETHPIATVTNLAAVLSQLSEVMDREQDVLFLFTTSHGSDKHELEIKFPPLNLQSITPELLREALDESGIKWRIVVISACYSGGFVEALRDPHTLVITASDAKHPSFGCTDDGHFTYFGKAFFDEALRKTRSFVDAFEMAKQEVTAREKKQKYEPSNPQIEVGEKMRDKLKELEARFDEERQRQMVRALQRAPSS